MTDLYDYDSLLQRARSMLPDTMKSSERFQIPEVEVVTEGKNTIFRNFMEFAKKIDRDPQHLYKYLLKELGTAGTIQGDRVIFKGKVTPKDIKDRINDYIKIYVLCYECGSPDTYIRKEGRVEIVVCKACGAIRPLHGKIAMKAKVQVKEGDVYEVEIIDISREGNGIAKIGEYTIFVPNAKKGEKVKVKIERIKKKVAFASVVR